MVQDDDIIEIDLENNSINLKVSPEGLEKRKAEVKRPERRLSGVQAAY